MVESEILSQVLNPLVLNLQKMELELKCPTCLKLLDEPIMMPCSHIFCSHCILTLGKNGTNCPSCDMPYVNKDLRPALHIKSLVQIYQNMKAVMAAKFPHQQSHGYMSGINYIKETSQEEVVHNMAAKANTSNPHEDEAVELATQGRKKPTHDTSEEGEPCSPPSFADNKDSDYDNSDGGSEFRIKGFPTVGSSRKHPNDGVNHITELDIGQTKRPKLNSRLDVGSTKGCIDAKEPFMPKCDSEYNHSNSPEVQPLRTSNCLDGSRIMECAFCRSFRTTEASGQMLHYLNGEPVGMDQASHPDVLHVHEKCIEWAPQVYFSGDTVMNLEAELSRASKIKCSSCGLKGAALGCYATSCRKSFHVPCAYEILECRWDCENFLVLCPAHSSHKLPCDRSKRKKNMARHSSESTSQSGDRISTTTENYDQTLAASPGAGRDLVLCGSALSKEEKDILKKFAGMSGAVVTNSWNPNVTHIIASTDDHGACSRTFKFLMAILSGEWVLSVKWVKACIEAGHPVEEEPYEITLDVYGSTDGPKNGRIRALKKAPKLYAGLRFYFSGYFAPDYKCYFEELILAAGGTIMKDDLICTSGKEISADAFVVYSLEAPEDCNSKDSDEVIKNRCWKAEAFAAKTGFRVIAHTWLLETIAACNLNYRSSCSSTGVVC